VVTWAQIGLHQKPCAILNVQGYYDPFVAMMNRSFDEGFISPVFRKLVLVDDDLDRLVDRMSATPKRPEGWDVTRKLA
jgi:predicted Rossmann-fold nucleotide-binding protein